MRIAPLLPTWAVLVASVLWANEPVQAQQPDMSSPAGDPRFAFSMPPPMVREPVPLAGVSPNVREQVRRVMEKPTLTASGPVEIFTCRPPLYYWLLDHPDRGAQAWRKLGTPCLEIAGRGEDRFGWGDNHGTDVCWETVYRGPELRVWYADGHARPGMLLPSLPLRAVVVLHHKEKSDETGRTRIQHQADLYFQTDSTTAALILRLIGPSAP